MGQAISVATAAIDAARRASQKKAEEERKKAEQRIQTMLNTLDHKLKTFEAIVVSSRGASQSDTEIDGGRSVMRVSEMRVATSAGISDQIKNCIGSFIKLAQGGEDAKEAAVDGAEALLTTGIDALFGVSSGASMEKQGFMVMFLNYAFVRVDYYMFSYNISAMVYGHERNSSGMCYLTDLAVLKLDELKSSEVDFLISQSIKTHDPIQRVKNLTALKIQLAESRVLSRLLRDADSSNLSSILQATREYMSTQSEIKRIFDRLPTFKERDNGLEEVEPA